MSERKVLNKYYPPDFDPSKIPRLRLPKTRQYTVRLMAPCNMRCNTCGDYIAKGKKFNARKETVEEETYLGLKVFRFYFKCPRCMAEITFKTDPRNMDYEVRVVDSRLLVVVVVEHGATPNFKALKLAEQQAVQEEKDREEDERLNPMKLLENRTKQSRRELEAIEALEDLKELNQRNRDLVHESDVQAVLEGAAAVGVPVPQELVELVMDKEFEAEERALLARIRGDEGSGDDSSDDEALPKFGVTFDTIDKEFSSNHNKSNNGLSSDSVAKESMENGSKESLKRKIDKLVVVKKKVVKTDDNCGPKSTGSTVNATKSTSNANNLLNLCAYGSSSDSE
ncbi:unnamed protein product [Oppiella nova]|uniref:Splicing factor YJU2 n=1 Tax=Oppiella nova TaxID=334625 RepID=A0A7R9MJP8_9ACAR|nr:unnamed protein product [Oppiella nova]CAG2177654.1 unnamed protein product [Oppiella nova]